MKASTLQNIADGAAVELFQHELAKIAANIADPNTKATAKRKVTLTFEFAPDEDREEVHCHVSAKSSLASTRGYGKTVYTGKMDGKPTIFSGDTKQMEMFSENVAQVKPGKAAGHA